MQIRSHARLLFPLGIVGLLFVVHLGIARQQAAQTQPYGRYNARQIRQLTEPLCLALAPQEEGLRLSLDHNRPLAHDGIFYRQWEVECLDKTGKTLFEFDWNADTGELIRFLRLQPSPPCGERGSLSRQEAVQTAWEWLRILGIVQKVSQAATITTAELSGDVWIVHWQTQDRTVTLHLARCSCELLEFQSERSIRLQVKADSRWLMRSLDCLEGG